MVSLSVSPLLTLDEPDDAGTETVGGRFKTQTGAGGGLVEKCGNDFTFQQLAIGVLLKLTGHLDEAHDALAREL